MDHHHSGHVITLVNSIIGVSILAMPYCFKQCGIILAFLILLISNLLTRVTCHFLIKSANIARRRTFEHLAFHIFGSLGKFGIEIGMIGFLIGTCIAFFVVMGDLGPDIISEITTTHLSTTMRTSILMALALFCVLPLGLLRNVDSLIGVSKATIGFYVCLILKIILEALPHLYNGDWIDKVELWKPAGVLQVLPIVSMALFCQTQLFEIYQAIEHPTLERLNQVVKSAVNTCTAVYLFVGFFGYVAFAHKSFGGNILLSFAPSFVTNAMKLGFILSLAFSFPLVIFPCRQSLYSLLYREGHSLHESISNYIPEGKFKGITMFIVFTSLIVSILIPTIEVVLGLVGSTIGVMICLIFPVACFICISQKDTNERLVAKFVLILALFIMVLGTYTNLRTLENIDSPIIENQIKIMASKFETKIKENNPTKSPIVEVKFNNNTLSKSIHDPEIRHEPPQPIEVLDEPKKEVNSAEKKSIRNSEIEPKIKTENVDLTKEETAKKKLKNEKESKQEEILKGVEVPQIVKVPVVNVSKISEPKINIVLQEKKNDDQVDIEAIKKDDNEMKLQIKDEEKAKHHVEEDHKILLKNMQKQNEIQENLVKQQKRLIDVIEKQQEIEKEQKLKAFKEIENIALKAIEKISGGDKDVNQKASVNLEKEVNKVIKESAKNDKPAENVETDLKNNAEPLVTEAAKKIVAKANNLVKKTNIDVNRNSKDTNNLNIENKDTPVQQLNILNKSNIANETMQQNKQLFKSMAVNIVEETKQKLEEIVKEVRNLSPESAYTNLNITELKTEDSIKTVPNKQPNGKKTYDINVENVDKQDKLKVEHPAAAPLFINLGQRSNDSTKNIKEKSGDVAKAVPVPVRLMSGSSNFTLDKNVENNDKNLNNDNDEVKVLRRDILFYSSINRKKR